MAILTKGTQVYALLPTVADPAVLEIVPIVCAKAFNPGGDAKSQIETTCLESDAKEYLPGLATPSSATLTIDADPRIQSHVRLYQAFQSAKNDNIKFAVGWSDGIAPPTLAVGGHDFVLPATRTWYVFSGYISDFPFDFAIDSVVATAMTIQRSGQSTWIQKTP